MRVLGASGHWSPVLSFISAPVGHRHGLFGLHPAHQFLPAGRLESGEILRAGSFDADSGELLRAWDQRLAFWVQRDL